MYDMIQNIFFTYEVCCFCAVSVIVTFFQDTRVFIRLMNRFALLRLFRLGARLQS